MKFGEKIFNLRKEKNWSQEKLAEHLGVSITMISKYEKGDVNASIEIAKKLSESFNVSLDYLVGNTKFIVPFRDKKMLDRFTKIEEIPEEDQKYITKVIDAFIRDYHTQKAYSKAS